MTDSFNNQSPRKRVTPQEMEQQIRNSLVEVQARLELLADTLPVVDDDPSAELTDADLSDKHVATIWDIKSIEEEWILDEVVRNANSIILIEDEDDEPDTFDMGDV